MKINHYKVSSAYIGENGESKLQEVAAQILRMLEHDVCNFKYVLPDGWRCIVKVIETTPVVADDRSHMNLLYLDVQSNRGGGSWAPAKIRTMEALSKYAAATQSMCMDDLREAAVSIHGEDVLKEHDNALEWAHESIDELTEENLQWVVDTKNGLGIAPGYGGISVPYECLVSVPIGGGNGYGAIRHEMRQKTGIIRIAFSGASQEQDLFFATSVLRVLVKGADDNFPTAQAWFNLRELEEIPTVRMWLDLLGIKKA